MKGIGPTECSTGKVSKLCQTVLSLMEIGSKAYLWDMGSVNIQMAQSTREAG